jgi:hypothetical protein
MVGTLIRQDIAADFAVRGVALINLDDIDLWAYEIEMEF